MATNRGELDPAGKDYSYATLNAFQGSSAGAWLAAAQDAYFDGSGGFVTYGGAVQGNGTEITGDGTRTYTVVNGTPIPIDAGTGVSNMTVQKDGTIRFTTYNNGQAVDTVMGRDGQILYQVRETTTIGEKGQIIHDYEYFYGPGYVPDIPPNPRIIIEPTREFANADFFDWYFIAHTSLFSSNQISEEQNARWTAVYGGRGIVESLGAQIYHGVEYLLYGEERFPNGRYGGVYIDKDGVVTVADPKWPGWKENGGDVTRDGSKKIDFEFKLTAQSNELGIQLKTRTADNDALGGSAGIDLFYGGAGNDTLHGAGQDDALNGEEGNDLLDGGEGHDLLAGSQGDDIIYGRFGADYLSGGEGNDYLDAGEDDDVAKGGVGHDVLIGWTGNDILIGGEGNDTIRGGAGIDYLIGGSGSDVLDGGEGSDRVNYRGATSYLTIDLTTGFGSGGEAEGDRLSNIEEVEGGHYGNTIIGNALSNKLVGGNAADILRGGAGSDTLKGGAGNDVLDDYGSNDSVGGNDILDGGLGNDTLFGRNGADTLIGGAGDDYLDAGEEDDLVRGGDGQDTMYGYTGNDTLEGGEGSDWADGGSGNDLLDGGAYNDTLFGRIGHDTLKGGTGNDYLDAGEDDDLLDGGSGADTLIGWTGNDRLEGGFDNDVLYGGADNDLLNGGTGNDVLYGGAGADWFFFDANSGSDVIKDFGAGDVIRLSGVTVSSMDMWGSTNKPVTTSAGTVITVGADRVILIEGIRAEQLKGGIVNGSWEWHL
jgi:Ca2+-binding RTX toxin-like protein